MRGVENALPYRAGGGMPALYRGWGRFENCMEKLVLQNDQIKKCKAKIKRDFRASQTKK
jgi:hypothetical protein